jgi:hypothetical protein
MSHFTFTRDHEPITDAERAERWNLAEAQALIDEHHSSEDHDSEASSPSSSARRIVLRSRSAWCLASADAVT